ncbi:MAG: acyloxyacyl hydrolase [Alphaproteobacteria bacterium]
MSASIRTGFVLAVAALGCAGLFARGAAASEPAFLAVSAGWYDINDDQQAAEFRAELRAPESWKLWVFTPMAGFMATTDGATYTYGGLGLDIFFGKRFVLTPSFAVGAYTDGGGKDLGHVIEFRSAIELAYRFDDRSRLGLSFYHLSNAGLDDNNPGTEVLSLTYALPLDRVFGR